MLDSYEAMRKDPVWIPVIAGLEAASWCNGDKEVVVEFRKHLIAIGKTAQLPLTVVRRLQTCFSPLVSPNPNLLFSLDFLLSGLWSHMSLITLLCIETHGGVVACGCSYKVPCMLFN